MDRRLRRYVYNRAHALARTFNSLLVDDLVNDCWTIFLRDAGSGKAFLKIRRYFNRSKMRAVREARRFVSMEKIENDPEFSYNPEDLMIARIDLREELGQIAEPESEWKERLAREKVREYLR